MPESNSLEPDQMLARVITALRDEPIPDFRDPFIARSGDTLERAGQEGSPPALAPRVPPQPVEILPRRRWINGWRTAAVCAAVVVAAGVAGVIFRSQTSLANVAAAVLAQPWVHVRTVSNADQGVNEAWLSSARGISASQCGGRVRYEDHRLQVYYSYNSAEQVLYRGPAASTSEAGRFETMAEALKVLVQADRLPDQPLARLGFSGPDNDRARVIEQRVEKVNEQERQWLDYRLTVQFPEKPEPVRMLFRVDPDVRLPRMFRVERQEQGKPVILEARFEYPGKGPADIYDLGVPRTARLVDRVPAGDLKRIVEALQAGRERMDNYRSVFVTEYDGVPSEWWGEFPQIFYRKGNRFRRDLIAATPRGNRRPAEPKADVDRRQWWFDRAKEFPFFPVYVQVGPVYYTCDPKSVTDPDGYSHNEIASVHKYDSNGEMIPVDYVMRPEFVCRPPMGIGNEHQEPTLDLHPLEGPPGCILLSMRHTTREGRVNEKGIGLPDGHRFWLDPQRDYIVMRWEMATRDDDGKETIISNHTVEEIARSPQGVWYATKVRLKNSVGAEDGKRADQIYRIYVDFDAELPDRLFDRPVPGRS